MKSKKTKTAARKIINPQRTIDAKVALVKKAGGKMAYEGKTWVVKKGSKVTELSSRELAKFTVPAFAKAFHLPRPNA